VVPPKIARKFKKAFPSKKDSDLVPIGEEPIQKGKLVKNSAKKSIAKPAAGVVIREAPVETKSKSKEKEKVDVTHGKGIELLFKGNDKDDRNNDQDSSNEYSEQENESEEQVSDLEQEEESEDDDQEEEEFVHKSNEESNDVNKSDEESDDVIKGDKEIVQGEGGDAEMTDAQQGNENLETTQEQVVKDAHVTISTVTKKTEVHVTSSSRSSNLASKVLNFLDIPYTDAEIVSSLDVHVHHEVPRT
ncbi:hypothetical protein Tco_1171905, partial [Tanacetum coccineum]